MSTVTWDSQYTASVADATETVVATVDYGDQPITALIALFGRMFVDGPDGDASSSVMNVRRGDISGPIVATLTPDTASGSVGAEIGTTYGPFFDGPGLPSSGTYVLTLAQTDATGPSTGVTAVLGLQSN